MNYTKEGKFKDMNEEWKDIAGYEGRYQVSNHGRIKSLSRTVENGKVRRVLPEVIMRQADHYRGYKAIYLRRGEGAHKRKFFVHRLVAFAFLPRPQAGQDVVNHRSCEKDNNHISNLEWMSYADNSAHWREKQDVPF